ncbi:MAG: FtsX-like permease family protein [Candidatus Competibacteraceae bacterium]
MNALLWRSLWRHLTRHPWQLALAIIGIALGVAVVLAVDLANASARKSFALSMEQVGGRATHRIRGGSQGIPETLYLELRLTQGVRATAPVVGGHVVAIDPPGKVFQVLGVDPFAEAPFRTQPGGAVGSGDTLARLLSEPGAVLLPPAAGRHDRLTVRVGERRFTLHSVGALDRVTLDNLILTDISTAQAMFGQSGRLSYIDLILPEGAAGEQLGTAIQSRLPPGIRLERTAERNQATVELSSAFSLNLTAMSLLALIVGMFLIYNTMTFVVVQRRALLGMLRALGVTRREVFLAVLGEALLLGLAGTLLGSLLGIGLGSALLRLVTRTVNDLYYVLSVRELYLAPISLLKVSLLGLLATTMAAWLPAREAANAPPGVSLSRAHLESRWRTVLPRLNLAGLALLLVGGLLLALSRSLVAGFTALFLMLLGCGLLAPAGVLLLASLNRLSLGRWSLLARMAGRDVARHLSRTGVAVAALMIAFATTVGVGVMVDSFRDGVEIWIEDLINADIYIAPPLLEEGDYSTPLRSEVLAELRQTPGVAAVSLYRRTTVDIGGRPVQLMAVELAPTAKQGYRFIDGDPATAWKQLDSQGAVIISEPLAYRQGLKAGMELTLDTDRGPQVFPIAGVFHDYGSEHGRILLHRSTYQRFWDDTAVGSVAVYVVPGETVATVRRHLEIRLGPLQELLFRSNRDIQAFTLAIFDRTFTITQVLRVLSIVVAFVGVLSALLALQLERAREFAVLRAIGMTTSEIGWLVSLQTGFLGFISGLLSLPVGLGLAAVLIFVINRRSFGWTLPFQVDPWILVQAVVLAMVAALLAGIYPIRRMARTHPAAALRAE